MDFFKGSAVTATQSPGMHIKTQISAATFSVRISGRGSQPGNLPFCKLPRVILRIPTLLWKEILAGPPPAFVQEEAETQNLPGSCTRAVNRPAAIGTLVDV